MTREEASNILWWASKRHYPGDQMDITAEDIEAFDMAIAALRGPEHDPDTWLMKCGCGGNAVVIPKDNGFYIVCDSCEVSTTQDLFFNGTGFSAQSLDDAREDWNTAMGWREKE